MIAQYLRTDTDEEQHMVRGALQSTGIGWDERQCLTLTSDGRGWSIWRRQAGPLSMLWPLAPSSLRAAALSPRLRLFDDAFTQALLAQVNRSVQSGGSLLLPVLDHRHAQPRGYLSENTLTRWFGTPQSRDSAAGMARFLSAANVAWPESILTWFFHECSQLAMAYPFAHTAATSDRIAELCDPFVIDTDPNALPKPAADSQSQHNLDVEHAAGQFLKWANYAVGGIGYKSAIIRHIISTMMGRNGELTMMDVGGGAGLLAAELLLQEPRIRLAVTREPMIANLVPAYRLYHYFTKLHGRFAMSIGSAEQLRDNRTYDIVTMIGSLLYVQRSHTAAVLDGLWERLRSGGLLIVHENIKNPAFTKDYDVMFTVDELEGYLRRYSSIEYYLSTATMRIDQDKVGERSVFRVVQKR